MKTNLKGAESHFWLPLVVSRAPLVAPLACPPQATKKITFGNLNPLLGVCQPLTIRAFAFGDFLMDVGG